jgi:hypothetical protein
VFVSPPQPFPIARALGIAWKLDGTVVKLMRDSLLTARRTMSTVGAASCDELQALDHDDEREFLAIAPASSAALCWK